LQGLNNAYLQYLLLCTRSQENDAIFFSDVVNLFYIAQIDLDDQ